MSDTHALAYLCTLCVISGVANVDYPTLSEIPETSFTCDGKIPGYYADQEASCQVTDDCDVSL